MIPTTTKRIDRLAPLLDTLDDLLVADDGGVHISIYQTLGTTPGEIASRRIEFKNSVDEIHDMLVLEDVDESRARNLLGVVREYCNEGNDLWEAPPAAIAAFLSEDRSEILRITAPVASQQTIGSGFHLKPLMALAANVEAFHLLLLTQGSVELYRASTLGMRKVDVEGMPCSLADFADQEGYSDSGHSTMAAMAQGKMRADRDHLAKYFKSVNAALCQHLDESHSPLLVAGDDSYETLYRELNHYPHLSDAYLSGNWQNADFKKLYKQAHHLLHSDFIASQKRELRHYKNSLDSGKAITDFGEVLDAAADGKVRVLFVPHDEGLWGRYDAANRQFTETGAASMHCTDLYEWAARETLAKGGEVFFLQANQMPHGRKAIALLRWSN